ncbi:hypothetical protein FHR55_000689 [Xanthomonas arboricola]
MRALPDKWNVRIWLRNWINKPTASETAAVEALREEMAKVGAAVTGYEASSTLLPDADARVVGITRMPPTSWTEQAR